MTDSGKEDFEGVLPYTGLAAILVMLINFHFHVLKSLQTEFGKNGPVVSEKSHIKFLM